MPFNTMKYTDTDTHNKTYMKTYNYSVYVTVKV